MKRLRGLCIGAGYYSQFHLDGWKRIPDVQIVGVCDLDRTLASKRAEEYEVDNVHDDPAEALRQLRPDFVDIITRSDSHLPLVSLAASHQVHVICQKPLAPNLETARQIVETAEHAGIRLMVHENFRFQPWHRELKRLIDSGAIGDRLHSLNFRSRPGDGWGESAYLDRQPYFRDMPQLLVFETGVHVIDTFRFLAGEIDETFAILRRLNPVIAGEDAGILNFRFAKGAVGQWDANRYNAGTAADPRLTFGELLIEGNGGSLRLYGDGRITIQPLGKPETEHPYRWQNKGPSGDSVHATQCHFAECLKSGAAFETSGTDYLRNLEIQDAVYHSARENRVVRISEVRSGHHAAQSKAGRRIVDLSLTIDNNMRKVNITPANTIEKDGWNATTLSLYSHCGTHMDAPRHFLSDGRTIDFQDLDTCHGPAHLIDLTPVEPRELLTVERLSPWHHLIGPGSRLLFRTDWYKRLGTPEYRDELPRISLELAKWLVDRRVALIGVEPPSVADVNEMGELTDVHQTLFRGNVVIIEGLANLDLIKKDVVELIALPLKVAEGDGCPVRAIAIENS